MGSTLKDYLNLVSDEMDLLVANFGWMIILLVFGSILYAIASTYRRYQIYNETQGMYRATYSSKFDIAIAVAASALLSIVVNYIVIGVWGKIFVGKDFQEIWTSFVVPIFQSFFL